MLLTISYAQPPATDLGYLLHKHPARVQSFPLPFGQAHIFYTEATDERCTLALLLDIDPVGLVRRGPGAEALAEYVSDRPYVASSFMSVAIGDIFGTALAGRSTTKPELAETALHLEATIAVIACRGGADLAHRLFAPLGYNITATPHPLDATIPAWGDSPYVTLTLSGTVRMRDLLAHLCVLIPVLDNDKHYWVGDDEVEKLLRRGAGWLAAHPERELITSRYLKRRRSLVQAALDRLTDAEAEADAPRSESVSLNDQRKGAVLAALAQSGATRVLDLGCGEGGLLALLLADPRYREIVGMDVSYRALETARERLHLDRLPDMQRARITFFQGSLIYRDPRLAGYDAAAVVEVIEHLDPSRLVAFERVLFGDARPRTIVLTTPNAEYNALYATLPAGHVRHPDHRFEWTRADFGAWANATAARNGYSVRFLPIGPEDATHGAPTQMAIFARTTAGTEAAA